MSAGGRHQWARVHEGRFECPVCGVAATRHRDRRYGAWTEYRVASGWTWHTGTAPPCPPPPVEALCPWDWMSMRYAGAKGDDQLDTAMRTWCERHQQAVSECEEPGPACPGASAHEDGEACRSGQCTGWEQTCRCMCPACCGDTPDMYGFDGDY